MPDKWPTFEWNLLRRCWLLYMYMEYDLHDESILNMKSFRNIKIKNELDKIVCEWDINHLINSAPNHQNHFYFFFMCLSETRKRATAAAVSVHSHKLIVPHARWATVLYFFLLQQKSNNLTKIWRHTHTHLLKLQWRLW